MTPEAIRTAIIESIDEIAPDLDAANIGDDESFRDELEIDSMDFLNIVEQLHERTGVEIPESDYPSLDSIGQLLAYLQERAG